MKVSVLIPAYNAANTLPATLQSIKSQTVPVHEVIVASDASTDETAQIARKWGATVLELPKGNGSIARNRAADAATGDVYFLLDADDIWHPEKVAVHLESWQQHPDASFLLDPSTRVRLDGSRRGQNGAGPDGPLTWQDMVQHRNWSSGSGLSIRKSAWQQAGGFNEKLPGLQDVEFLIRLAHDAGPGHRISRSLTDYYLYPGGVSKSVNWTESLLAEFAKSVPFLTKTEWAALRRTISLRNALAEPFPKSLPHFAQAGWPVADIRFWKYLLLSMRKAIVRG